MKKIIVYFKSWTIMRYLRLGLGVAFLFEMFNSQIWILGIAAAFFFLQAFFNFGCTTNQCAVRQSKND